MAYRTQKTLKTLALTGTAMALIAYGPAAAQAAKKIEFDIEAQELGDALNEFGVQSGKEVYYLEADIAGKQTKGVEGVYSADEAINLLLNSTGIPHTDNGSGTILIGEAYIQRAFLGEESAPAPFRVAQLDQEDSIREVASRDDEDNEARQDVIVVTGTNIRGAAAKSSPVLSFDRDAIDKTGFSTTQDVIQSLPQNFGGGPNASTTNLPGTSPDSAVNLGFGAGINLRGLGASSTLTVVNGRRMAPSGSATFTDVSAIPLSAIQRIEVLTDGASAIYGSDAIGGVVNVILRDDFDGAETSFRYGSVTDGDKDEFTVRQLFGTSWDSGNLILSYEYQSQDALFSADRPFAATSDLTALGGDNFDSFFSNPGNIADPATFFRTPLFGLPTGQDGTALSAGDINGAPNSQNTRLGTTLVPKQERHSAFLALKQEVNDRVEFFAEGRFTDREFDASVLAATSLIPVDSSNPFFVDPTSVGFVGVLYSFIDDLGPQTNNGSVTSCNGTLGTNIEFAESWNAELFGTHSREKNDIRLGNQVNSVLLDEAVGTAFVPGIVDNPDTTYNPLTDGLFNPFGDGSNSPQTVIDAIRGFNDVTEEAELTSVNLIVDGDLFSTPGGIVKLAVGGEFRNESFQTSEVDFRNTALPESELGKKLDRDVYAVFGEVLVPIIGPDNARPGLRELELSVAGRFEDYSDFGTTTNPKVGIFWSPLDGLGLRGTYGTSFKAPGLSQLDITSNSFTASNVADHLSPTGRTNVVRLFGNNADLMPEEATTWTAGLDFQPSGLPGLDLGVTYFNINFENRIVASSSSFSFLATPENEAQNAARIDRAPDLDFVTQVINGPNFRNFAGVMDASEIEAILDARLSNVAVTDLSGMDFNVSYSEDTDIGVFNIGLNGVYYFDYEEAESSTSTLEDVLDTIGNPVDLRLRGAAGWQHQGLSANVFVNYLDGYTDNINNAQNVGVNSYTTVDLRVAYQTGGNVSNLLEDMSFSLSVQNLFDEDPPFVNNRLGVGFDPEQSNPLGRFVAFQVSKRW